MRPAIRAVIELGSTKPDLEWSEQELDALQDAIDRAEAVTPLTDEEAQALLPLLDRGDQDLFGGLSGIIRLIESAPYASWEPTREEGQSYWRGVLAQRLANTRRHG